MACQASISLTDGFQPTPLTSSKQHYRIDHGKNHGVRERSKLSRTTSTTLMAFDNMNNLMGGKDEKHSDDDDKNDDEKSTTKIFSPGQKLMEKYSKSPENLLNKALGKVDNIPSAAAAPTAEAPIPAAPKVTTSPPTPPTITSASTQTDDNAPIYKEGLDSKNPFIRLKAQVEVAAAEKQRDIRIAKNKKIEQINVVKKQINDVKESAQRTYKTVINIPSEIEKKVEETQQSIQEFNEKTKNTIEEVQKTPQKVQKAVDDTKKKVEETQQATVDAINEVKAIPGKVEKSVNDTKEKIKRTKRGTEEFISKVQNFAQKFDSGDKQEKIGQASDSRFPIQNAAADTPESIADIDAALEAEVSDALKTAKQALKNTQSPK